MRKKIQNSLSKRTYPLASCIIILLVVSITNCYSQFNFSVEGPITITTSTFDITVNNFDNSGRPEAVVTHVQNYNSTTPSTSNIVTYIKYNTGSSAWESSIIENVGGYASQSITSGDYDSDGNMDFAFTSYCNCGNYYLYKGDGAGGFTNATPTFSGNRFSYDMATGDLNNDGKPDIVTGGNTMLSKFLNTSTGAGNFSFNKTSFIIASSDNSSYGYALADFNGDGFKDLVAAVPAEAKVRVFLNDGYGGFNSAVYTDYNITGTSTSNIRGVATGDFNDDGYPDIVAASYNGNAIGILINSADGTGTFDPVVLYSVTTPKWVEVGDLNSDGFLDIAVAANNISIFSGNGDGTFSATPYSYNLAGVNRLRIADMNNDGRNDLAVITSSTFRALLSTPSTYTWTGAVSTDWNNAGNWDLGIPSLGANIIIPTGLTNYPELEINPTINNITVATGTSVEIPANQTFTINGSLTNNGTINIGSTASGDGSLLISGTISGSGTYNVNRYLAASKWHLVSSPITTGLSGVFENIWLRPYNEATNAFGEYIVPTTIPMPTGQGFSVWTNTANEIRTFSGLINHGTVTPSIQLTGTAGPSTGWNLIGNPYPSAIDWNAASGWTKTNVGSTIYVWNNNQYATWNGSVGTNGGSRYVAMEQGFFVQASAVGAAISMNNSVRLHNSVTYMKNVNEEPADIIRVNVSMNNNSDETVIAFNSNGSDNFNFETDAVKLPGSTSSPQMHTTKNDNSPLAISTLNAPENVVGKYVYIDYAETGTHQLLFTHTLTGNYIPRLYDNVKQTIVEPNTPYTFNASVGDPSSRFQFVESAPLSVSNTAENTNLTVWESNRMLYIINPADEQIKQIQIYSADGRLVCRGDQPATDLRNLSSGIYVVKVITTKKMQVQKITVE